MMNIASIGAGSLQQESVMQGNLKTALAPALASRPPCLRPLAAAGTGEAPKNVGSVLWGSNI